MDDVTLGSGYESLRQTAAALQACLANGVNDLPPELSSSLDTSPQPVLPQISQQMSRPTDPSIIPAAGGLQAVPRATGPDGNDLTPIFHALSSGGWTDRQPQAASRGAEVDPAADFRRDPLGAPIPTQATSESGKMAEVRPLRPLSAGRHRRDRPATSESVWTG